LWAVGERGDKALRIDPTTFAVESYSIVGCPSETDLEALAWMADGRFVVGTETQEAGRTRDLLLYARIEGGQLAIRSVEAFDYGLWGLTASDNHGIEGLCHVDEVLMLATELIGQRNGRRWAPLAMLDQRTQSWTAHRVSLTSKTGKLAALGCRIIDGEVAALAVERHFGVSRLVRFEVPKRAQSAWIQPRIVADLSQLIDPLPNFEGLVWEDNGSVILLTDNEYRGVAREPSRLYFIPASALK
jgi:hypothetical protein